MFQIDAPALAAFGSLMAGAAALGTFLTRIARLLGQARKPQKPAK